MERKTKDSKNWKEAFVTFEHLMILGSAVIAFLFTFTYFMIGEIKDDLRHIHTEIREDMCKISIKETAYLKSL